MQFMHEYRLKNFANSQNKEKSVIDVAKQAGSVWKNMPDHEKKKFNDMYAEGKKGYY